MVGGMKALVLLMAVVVVGCGNSTENPQNSNKEQPEKPEGVYFFWSGDEAKHIFDFRSSGNLSWEYRWKRPRPANTGRTAYDFLQLCKWHLEGDLVITEIVKEHKHGTPSAQIFRFEDGTLFLVGYTDHNTGERVIDERGSAESVRLTKE